MSGFLEEAFTPCPSRSRYSGSGSETFDSFMESDSACEATGQIEFTTEIRAPVLTGSRPRRANRTGSSSTFQIHSDVPKKPIGPGENRRRPNANSLGKPSSGRTSSLLAQPAHRFRPKVSFDPSPPFDPTKKENGYQGKTQRDESNLDDGAVARPNDGHKSSHEDKLKRNVRRNTVYIPPDDTTVASVFMGLFSPLKSQQPVLLSKVTEDTQVNTLEAQIARRQARKSMAASARRAPLQPSTKIAQEATTRVDIAGKNGGKENIPPGTLIGTEGKRPSKPSPTLKPKRANVVTASKPTRCNADQRPRSTQGAQLPKQPLKQNASAQKALEEKQNNAKSSRHLSVQDKPALTASKMGVKSSESLDARASPAIFYHESASQQSSQMGILPSKLKNLNYKYPMLIENTAKPALYEDNWLFHQETVITQLVNSILESPHGNYHSRDSNALRLEFLEIYHTEFFAQLHKRLQASLSCGTLSIPKGLVARYSRLTQDVGFRRKFLDIWVRSYDLRALVAAAETVVGRKVSNDSQFLESDIDNPDNCTTHYRKVVIRKLEDFLSSFLLHNVDMDQMMPGSRDIPMETDARAYRRTVLRSILLVVILDQAIQSERTSLRRLFVQGSPFASSSKVLQALARLLLPSCGDISKSLGHLGCDLKYRQHQLQEFNYQMNNIAIDLRDGIRLTRLVEIFFFAPKHELHHADGQAEVNLQAGEELTSPKHETDFPLSKRLKYPCMSRAAKLYNVQIGLSALRSVKGSDSFLTDIRAEDIVDGYREKTMALLWALVSQCGLAGLVDWEDIDKEIARLKQKAISVLGQERCLEEPWFTGNELDDVDEHTSKLQQWASILAALKGLSITNLTTSFANDRVYESIIDEYEPYVIGNTGKIHVEANRNSLSLESRLKRLGCSSQFAQLVCPKSPSSHILDHDFTLGVLAFLCSRLLSASKHPRAATIIQRAWRDCLTRRNASRRAIAYDLASKCAAVVETRGEIIWAKGVIIRWWRDINARKHRRNPAYQERPTVVSRTCKTNKRRL